ncbi:hypothetical protein GCM10007157_26400 [Vreelandella hamiltonii]|uniref:Uncharacterized protein n=1 Tax=Vreelandella hamiltonii TaxID=502829 RepID=A0A8H9M1G1_9GAMM|nr:hypothetical protein GCM10007157_26400 [Halomonas hamiltonii]
MRHPRRAAASRPDHATTTNRTTANLCAPIGSALRAASRVRSAYAALRVSRPSKCQQHPVARRNESCEARANEAPAKGGASRPDHATTTNRTTAHLCAPIGSALRAASRVRFAYAALRISRPSKLRQHPVARRNESCEARANEAPAKGGASRPDHATNPHRATAAPCAPIGSAPRAASRVRSAYAALRVTRPSKFRQHPVARCNESCEARANEAPAAAARREGGASRPDHATTTNRTTAHLCAPIGSAPRAASRVRFAYAALRVSRPSKLRQYPVARRNESCEARANEAPAKGGASRPDHATIPHRATAIPVPLSAALLALLRGCAPLTPRYG